MKARVWASLSTLAIFDFLALVFSRGIPTRQPGAALRHAGQSAPAAVEN